jgi:biotin operon repressor
MASEAFFLGVSRAAPPVPGVIRLLAPSQEVSTRELPFIDGPKVILGGPPCDHWSSVIAERNDLLYVMVPEGYETAGRGAGDALLPPAPVPVLRRHFSRLLELKQRYACGLPQVAGTLFRWKGIEVPLTPAEADIVRRLYQHEGAVVSREDLAAIAGCNPTGSRALDAHIHRLRSKLNVPGVEVLTERQRGFRLVLS